MDRSPGGPCRPEPPLCSFRVGCGHGRVIGGAASILFWRAAVRRPQAWSARCSGALVWARLSAATPAGAGGWGRWGARCAGPAASPPPAARFLLEEGGRPLGSEGAGGRSCGPQAGGGGAGGGHPPAPSGVGLPSVVSGLPPRGALLPWGLPGGRGRRARSGRPPMGECGRGGGGGGGNPPAPVRASAFPGPASEGAALFAPSWAPLVRRRPAAGRACGRLPRPWCPGAAASSGGVRGRCFLGLPLSALGPEGEGGGEVGGGPLVPWRRPLTADGGRPGGAGPGGQPSAGGSHSSPAPLYLELDPRAGPRSGPSFPSPSHAAGRPGAAVRVSGQRLAGCGAVGSPPRSLSPPSLPRGVARAPPSRRIVGGAWAGGPSSPPHLLVSAVWAVTCAAACVGAGAVAGAGCAGGSASGRGRCARPGGGSCWRPRP